MLDEARAIFAREGTPAHPRRAFVPPKLCSPHATHARGRAQTSPRDAAVTVTSWLRVEFERDASSADGGIVGAVASGCWRKGWDGRGVLQLEYGLIKPRSSVRRAADPARRVSLYRPSWAVTSTSEQDSNVRGCTGRPLLLWRLATAGLPGRRAPDAERRGGARACRSASPRSCPWRCWRRARWA